ncbi:PREDICTED: defensin-like protein 21 [Tarenaya hassleriana]|uniref:defensin-like protein 21 n=1 Tax=Tarenaya hassleriana TaxID=28532 RepID=UPI00053C7EAB|nr:PREDICTED: defensin-like protein 21 [Tarenaya hassleriana]
MYGTKASSFVLILALILCIGSKEIAGDGPTSNGASRCCREHPELGSCVPGIDDDGDSDGRCWTFCAEDCARGGFCKAFGNTHKCHCYC